MKEPSQEPHTELVRRKVLAQHMAPGREPRTVQGLHMAPVWHKVLEPELHMAPGREPRTVQGLEPEPHMAPGREPRTVPV